MLFRSLDFITAGVPETNDKHALNFFRRAIYKHGTAKFRYDTSSYVDKNTPIEILCVLHNLPFFQKPSNHLAQDNGCPGCIAENHPRRLNTATMLERLRAKHGPDRFDWSESVYSGGNQHITVGCFTCGKKFYPRARDHMRGSGCPHCYGNTKITFPELVARSEEKYGAGVFDFSQAKVVTSSLPVIITHTACATTIHVTPYHHLHSKFGGCTVCSRKSGRAKLSQLQTHSWTQVEKELREKHGLAYRYPRADTEYKNTKSKITIECVECAHVWPQRVSAHLGGQGCPQCAIRNRDNSDKTTKPLEQYLLEIREKWGDLFSYPNIHSEYKNGSSRITIHCETCNHDFKKRAASHLYYNLGKSGRRTGCPHCGAMNRNERFRELQKSRHIPRDQIIADLQAQCGDEYELIDLETNYQDLSTKIPVRHRKCGRVFTPVPINFRAGKKKCPHCVHRVSNNETRWLDFLGVEQRQLWITLPNRKRICVDGYDPRTNTIFEFHGDYWHGNPNLYPAAGINGRTKRTHGESYQRTLAKEQAILAAGYRLVTIWESEWLELEKSLKTSENADEFLIFSES